MANALRRIIPYNKVNLLLEMHFGINEFAIRNSQIRHLIL